MTTRKVVRAARTYEDYDSDFSIDSGDIETKGDVPELDSKDGIDTEAHRNMFNNHYGKIHLKYMDHLKDYEHMGDINGVIYDTVYCAWIKNPLMELHDIEPLFVATFKEIIGSTLSPPAKPTYRVDSSSIPPPRHSVRHSRVPPPPPDVVRVLQHYVFKRDDYPQKIMYVSGLNYSPSDLVINIKLDTIVESVVQNGSNLVIRKSDSSGPSTITVRIADFMMKSSHVDYDDRLDGRVITDSRFLSKTKTIDLADDVVGMFCCDHYDEIKNFVVVYKRRRETCMKMYACSSTSNSLEEYDFKDEKSASVAVASSFIL